ncbi:pentapeptide repeat-containing protein [Phormidesmis priestleyi]|nr:pentapeptide repeat-containing protein [Phormidesmis priestleyi]
MQKDSAYLSDSGCYAEIICLFTSFGMMYGNFLSTKKLGCLGCWLGSQFKLICQRLSSFNVEQWINRVYKRSSYFLVVYTAAIFLLMGVFVAGTWGFWILPQLRVASEKTLTPKERIELENATRSSLAQSFGTLSQTVGGIVLVIGVYFTWRNLIATEDKQVTERFTKAIEQLGSEKPEVCMGGIYALERIASDSEKDHWSVMEVLCSFVRHRSSIDKNRGNQQTVSKEIQAALTVIKRRKISQDPKQKNLDLSFSYLKGANLGGEGFQSSILRKENFVRSNLREADFTGSNLELSDFTGSNLVGACFSKANLDAAEFTRANLSQADFTNASTIATKFTDTNLLQAKGLKPS